MRDSACLRITYSTPGVAYNMGGQITIMVMVLCGSLGFAMYLEIVRRARVALGWDARNTVSRHWSTYSWLVVRMTAALVLGGGLILFLIKIIDGSLFTSADPWYWILWESLFNATARTAGFNISDMALNSAPYALFLGALMFIGGNPGSTTGGVHTTAFAVSCGEVARILQGKKDVVMHKRRIARNVVERAVITVILAGAWVGMMTTVMCFAEPRLSLERLFFEVVSSFATVGFSWNVTPELSDAGKWIIVFNMIVGRVGMVAFVLAFMKQPTKSPCGIRKPDCRSADPGHYPHFHDMCGSKRISFLQENILIQKYLAFSAPALGGSCPQAAPAMNNPSFTSYQKIWLMSYPLMISLIIEHMIGLTDAVFLGRVGDVALGACALGGVYYIPCSCWHSASALAHKSSLRAATGNAVTTGLPPPWFRAVISCWSWR